LTLYQQLGELDRQGINGVYWLEIVGQRPDGLVVVRNITEGAKREVQSVQTAIEPVSRNLPAPSPAAHAATACRGWGSGGGGRLDHESHERRRKARKGFAPFVGFRGFRVPDVSRSRHFREN
jgi:hypothetical protein